jgi:hypothetical protein
MPTKFDLVSHLNVTLILQSIDDLKIGPIVKSKTDPIVKLIDAVISDLETWAPDQIKGSVGHPRISTITINVFGSKISDQIPVSMSLSPPFKTSGFDSNQYFFVTTVTPPRFFID